MIKTIYNITCDVCKQEIDASTLAIGTVKIEWYKGGSSVNGPGGGLREVCDECLLSLRTAIRSAIDDLVPFPPFRVPQSMIAKDES